MKSPSGFLWKNHWKKETLLTYYYSAIFRMQLLLLPPGKLRKGWGRENEESAGTASREGYRQAARIAQIVGKVCDKTPWESKCLVRALAEIAGAEVPEMRIHRRCLLGEDESGALKPLMEL